jgi:hypothetical protein
VRRPSGRALGQTPSYDRVKRRSIIVALAALVVASKGTASAQQASPKIPRVGILAPAETDKTAFFVAFRSGLRDLGWVEGRNIILEFRLAHFDWTLLPRLAQDLVNLPVDVIVTSGGGAARIAMEATSKIPIVTIGVDPALFGLVESLARPRVNVTGFSLMSPELTAKRLEILRTTFPHISTVAVLVNTANPASKSYLQLTEDAARSLGLPIVTRVESSEKSDIILCGRCSDLYNSQHGKSRTSSVVKYTRRVRDHFFSVGRNRCRRRSGRGLSTLADKRSVTGSLRSRKPGATERNRDCQCDRRRSRTTRRRSQSKSSGSSA